MITYSKLANAAYIYLTRLPHNHSKTYACDPIEVDGMIHLDFDSEGRLTGIEVLGASSKLHLDLLKTAEVIDN